MSTEKMREAFEAAYAVEQKEVYTAHGEDYFDSKECFLMHEDGYYMHDNTQSAWWGWKASRAAIEVELPSAYQNQQPYACYEGGWNDMRGEAVDNIESLGLKVKG